MIYADPSIYENGSQEEEERKQRPGKGPVLQSRSTLAFLGLQWWYWRWGRHDYIWVMFWGIELTGLNNRLDAAMREMKLPR